MNRMERKVERLTTKEMNALDKAEDAKLKETSDALLDALKLLDSLEEQKDRLEAREEVKEHQQISERIADLIANFGGSIMFAVLHVFWFSLWIYANTGHSLFGLSNFDPFPFGLLTMIVSLEAIFLSTFILISQNRQSTHDRNRDEIDFERDRLDLKVDTLAAKTIREATIRIMKTEELIEEINRKIDKLMQKRTR